MNEQNLIYGSMRSQSEARENGRKGGKASGEKRRQLRTMREELEALLSETVKDKNGKEGTLQYSITAALIKKANGGDVRAYEAIRDTIGQKPIEHVEVAVPDRDELKRLADEFTK